MPLILIAVVIVVGLLAAFWLTSQLIGVALHLFVAGGVGALADAVVPGKLPYGFLGAIAAGIVGGFLGSLIFSLVGLGNFGPGLFGVRLIPTFIGAAALAFGIEFYGKLKSGQRF